MKSCKILILMGLLVISACKGEPKPIAYGGEGCQFCSMTIVDKQHAAQFMTKKGRSYSFDAVECMLNYLKDVDPESVALYRVNDYNNPGVFIDATEATYLISKNIPSPMGAFLTAFANEEEASSAQSGNTGTIYSWPELRDKFEKDNPF